MYISDTSLYKYINIYTICDYAIRVEIIIILFMEVSIMHLVTLFGNDLRLIPDI